MIQRKVALGALVLMALSGLAMAGQYDKPGFVTKEEKGRLWVFKADSKELADAEKNGFPEKAELRIGAGPEGMTLKAPSDAIIQEYLDAK